ncbi:MAG TPA: CHAT domain-containing protein [Ornithinibacter sp.]|nr:CHAT domain-containing protein [Ornithinibacter sp.]
MAGIETWDAVAQAVAALDDDGVSTMTRALAAYGMTESDRSALARAISGRADAAGRVLATVVDTCDVRPEPVVPHPAPTAADMDRARSVAAALRVAPVDALSEHVSADQVATLWALPADDAGSLVLDLVTGALAATTEVGRRAGLGTAEALSALVPVTRLPVAGILASAGRVSGEDAVLVARILARSPSPRLLRELAKVLRSPGDTAALAALLEVVAGERATLPEPTPQRPRTTSAEPPEPVYRGGARVGASAAEPQPKAVLEFALGQERVVEPGPSAPASRTAYPRIDLGTGTARPDVVVVDTPFEVTVGLAPRKSRGIVSSGTVATPAGEDTVLEVVLVHDPGSLVPAGATRFALTVTDADPYPAVTVGFTAVYIEDGPPTRRIGVHYLRDGQVVAVAFRSFACVDDASQVATAPVVPSRDAALLDLAPVAAADAPDLVVAVCRSDASPTSWVWTAYAGSSTLAVPDAPNVAALGDDVSGFALNTRRAIQFSTDRVADYYTLAGRAKRIGAAIPDGIQAALHAVVSDPGRTVAPAVLLLTEELYVPWELGTIEPPLSTPWGGSSPFLGAHAAIGRWPLSEQKPRPSPRAQLAVRTGAVVTADYTGVPGWGKLDHALTEATAVARLFSPPATSVPPDLVSIIDLLRGTPAADVVHVALHGQFDAQGDQEGIVLLTKDRSGAVKPIFLTPIEVENGDLGAGPLVFLNACQVGADKRVLGSYGGFATTLLRIGAGAVVAPLWNIDDDVAASLAESFYAQTWTAPEPVGVGEAMRSIRARYTEDAVEAGTPGVTATLVAFQVFGHPRLRLTRPT